MKSGLKIRALSVRAVVVLKPGFSVDGEALIDEMFAEGGVATSLPIGVEAVPRADHAAELGATRRRGVAHAMRDLVREHIEVDGLPVHVVDTAGLRQAGDIEADLRDMIADLVAYRSRIEGMREVFAEQEKELNGYLGQLDSLLSADLANVNGLASKLGIGFVVVPR